MDSISIKMFNNPEVTNNSKKIIFPFRKAEALFYYLVINKQATRDELVDLLWEESGYKSGRKNLRNTMYKIRKVLDMDVIISPQRSIVTLNPEILINTDLDILDKEESEDLTIYRGEFLKGLYVKDAPQFEAWLSNRREYYKHTLIEKIRKVMNEEFVREEYEKTEDYGRLLIELDEFDERAYRMLMQIYMIKGNPNKALSLYNKLEGILGNELGISPDNETREVLKQVVLAKDSEKGTKHQNDEDFFYGREKHLRLLRDYSNNLFKGHTEKSVIILGEAGIGKTKLKDRFLETIDRNEIIILESSCYQAEKEYFLKPWYMIFSRLWEIIKEDRIDLPSTWTSLISSVFPEFTPETSHIDISPLERMDILKFQAIEDAILGVLKRLSQRRRILLVFEDIQWMDPMSLTLLATIILRQSSSVSFLATCRNVIDRKMEQLITTLRNYDRVMEIRIDRFTKQEVEDFITMALPEHTLSKDLRNRIYKETEGNTFFLMEFINSLKNNQTIDGMTTKMQDILKSRFVDISDDAKKLLDIISLFFDEATLDILEKISGKDELQIMDYIEELQNRNIIEEIKESEKISFRFTHQKLREFIYYQQAQWKRKVLHNRVAVILEETLKNSKSDSLLYSKLIYHYSNAGNRQSTVKYIIKNTSLYLDFNHELFPILDNVSNLRKRPLDVDIEDIIAYLNNIEKMVVETVEKEGLSVEVDRLKLAFLHLKGRYLIREGEYEEGVECVQKMITYANRLEEYENLLKGYRQMIYYSIQTHNVETMTKYCDLGLKLASEKNNKVELGIFFRLKGLNKSMAGDYDEAERLLKESIEVFKDMDYFDNKYSVNIAAAYNYIGEIRRENMQFSSALNYYDKAISLCKGTGVVKGLNIFNTNAGQAAFEMGDYEGAKLYFKKALELYRDLDFLWGRSIAEGYMSLLLIKEGEFTQALVYLKRADEYSKKYKNPHELGIVNRIKTEIRANMERNNKLNKAFAKYLPLSPIEYCDKGIELLKKSKSPYELDILMVFRKSFS